MLSNTNEIMPSLILLRRAATHIIQLASCALLWVLLVLNCSSRLSATILPCPSVEIFAAHAKQADNSTLVIFDVDHTLITPKDKLLRPAGDELLAQYISQLRRGTSDISHEPLTRERFARLVGVIYSMAQIEIVEPTIVDLIRELQAKNVKMIAISAAPTGSFTSNVRVEDLRIQQLYNLGIEFHNSFPNFYIIPLHNPFEERNPIFIKGLICTDGAPKGPIIKRFLEKIGWLPAKVLDLDNKHNYLQSAEESFRDLHIPFMGFHYTYLQDRNEIVDKKIAHVQMTTLLTQDKWLSDEEARKLLQGNNRSTSSSTK